VLSKLTGDAYELWYIQCSPFYIVFEESSELNYFVQSVAYPPPPRPGLKLIEMKIRFSNRMKGVSFKTVVCDHVPVDGNGCMWLIWNMLLTCFCLSLNVAIVKY
jgi:hypothetical protein